ncbi:hypothetical protein DYB26_009241 [Aphanomyces astaci]|uniref:Activator of Hsp90 ATPase AHSA1-like N-terminal domain-containing protein n=2 Tax=Aphanomyces astaci TaxID=112090 RepID=A0A418FPM4_APHAT|nr:hypothetical protein DYB26_009241 [Aphanomyces astaci]
MTKGSTTYAGMSFHSREEINKSQWAKESLKRFILEEFQIVDAATGWNVRATTIVKCDGDAKVCRGKKRCGYDIALEFDYEGVHVGKSETSSGKINLHDFEDTNGEDYEIHVKSTTSSAQDKTTVAIIKKHENALRTFSDHIMAEELVQRVVDAVVAFFAKEDTGHLVTASILSVSILMTIALLSQGSTDSVFQHGFGVWGQHAAADRIQGEERERDEAEREIFQESNVSGKSTPEEIVGADLFLATKLPWITLSLAVVVVAGSVHVAVSSPL